MTTGGDEAVLHRAADALWRDTGEHVVVTTPAACREVFVLGGGHAQLWRLLEEPCSRADLTRAFADGEGTEPVTAAVSQAVDELLHRELLMQDGGGPR